MIVPMKKVTVLVSEQDHDQALRKLRELGVMHVDYVKPPVGEDILYLEEELNSAEKALAVLNKHCEGYALHEPAVEHAEFYVGEVLTLAQEKENLEAHRQELQAQMRWYEEWGDVSLASIKRLEQAGVYLRLYAAPKTFLKTPEAARDIYIVGEDKIEVRLAYITRSIDDRLNLREVALPEKEMAAVREETRHVDKELDTIIVNICRLGKYAEILSEHRTQLQKAVEFERVRHGMGEAQSVRYLNGYAPVSSIEKVLKTADQHGWGYMVDDPSEDDNPPTLVERPKWLQAIEPVFAFMGTVPGYREYDISMWLLLFLSLFFAMLIGDAGYGLIFLGATFFVRRKLPDAPRSPFVLMYILSTVTIVWGAMTGTWFGAERLAGLPVLKNFIVPRLYGFDPANQDFMMWLTFLIGAIHLTLAHLLIAVRTAPDIRALTQVGWIGIVWGLYFVANNLILQLPIPAVAMWMLGIGAILVFIFSLVGVPASQRMMNVMTFPLSVISSFSDIVSYVRLFAVGFATVIVASSFNQMALGAGVDNILSGFIAALILVAGHVLNIVLGLMAVIVHGIRLNMLEFSGHLGMEWSGREYSPFKE
jgi:V/A-type H+-transporting ATPase subunit I